MRLHSDIITRDDIRAAATLAGTTVYGATPHNSRRRARAFEVFLTGHGQTGGQYGNTDGLTASWDEWGMALAALYALDPAMLVGPSGKPIYASAAHFHAVTDDRYRTLTPAGAHHRHRWQNLGAFPDFDTHQTCTGRNGCGARVMTHNTAAAWLRETVSA